MGALQVLEEQFADDGLQVLGFYSNDFGNQGGNQGQTDNCTDTYGITFDQFAIAPVTPPAQPVFAWLQSQPNPGPAPTVEPVWNFHKYLIARDGTFVATWGQNQWPGDNPSDPNDSFDTNPIVVAIQAELAKPKP
jgi:glutathione peroxidase